MNSIFYFDYARDVFAPAAIDEARRRPAILHFEGPDDVKPWHVGSTHPHRSHYLRELRATLWLLPLPLAQRLAYRMWYALPMSVRRPIAWTRHHLIAALATGS
jgi:hypothetical protein